MHEPTGHPAIVAPELVRREPAHRSSDRDRHQVSRRKGVRAHVCPEPVAFRSTLATGGIATHPNESLQQTGGLRRRRLRRRGGCVRPQLSSSVGRPIHVSSIDDSAHIC